MKNNFKLSPWPYYSKEEIIKSSQILSSGKVNYLTGEQGKLFEREFSKFCDAKYSIALANGTVALDLALKVLDISKGDEVIVTPRSYIASVSSVFNCGAKPIFADVDINSGNITSGTILKKITKKTKAIICVHLGGWPCEMDSIMKLAKKHNLFVIEDCAQAHGAIYKNKSVGSIGDIGTWSFCQDKIMTTGGEGGMISTNNYNLWNKMWSYKDHGKSFYSMYKKKHPPGYRWHHESFGTNWRMTEIQAAIGRVQLKKMKRWNQLRSRNATFINNIAKKFNEIIYLPAFPKDCKHAFYRSYLYVKEDELEKGWTRDKIIEEINYKNVPCFSGSCSEIYLEKAFIKNKLNPSKRLPNAKKIGERSLCFLVHPTITKDELNYIGSVLKKVFKRASKVI